MQMTAMDAVTITYKSLMDAVVLFQKKFPKVARTFVESGACF
jgi:hypothetical protein